MSNSDILNVAFSSYGHGLGFKQANLFEHDMWIHMIWCLFLNNCK